MRARSAHGARDERGGALLELAIVLPIIVILLALILDTGLGFAAARDTSSAARAGARVAALSGDSRTADFRALDAVRGQLIGSSDQLVGVAIYRSPPGGDGAVPDGCRPGELGVAGTCNVYSGAAVAAFAPTDFASPNCAGDPDAMWCPEGRAADADDFVGVAVWTTHDPTVGLAVPDEGFHSLNDRAVFALYFPDDLSP